MKALNKIIIVLFIFFFLGYNSTHAQEDFVLGQIVQLDGTIVAGRLDVKDFQSMSKRINFMDEKGNITLLMPNELASYQVAGGPKFVSKDVDGVKYFLQMLFEGKANLYTRRDFKGKNHFYIDKKGFPLKEILFTQEVISTENGNYLSTSKQHEGLLTLYMDDAPVTKESIKYLKPNYKSLINIFERYHSEVCPNEICYIFVDKTPAILWNLEPSVSWINYQHSNKLTLNNRNLVPALYINIGLPRQSKTAFLRIGALLSRTKIVNLDGNDKEVDFFKMSIHWLYISPSKILKPKFSCGFDYILPHQAGFGLMAGLNVQLNNQMAITTSYDYHAVKIFSYSKQYFKPHHLNLGFEIKFN